MKDHTAADGSREPKHKRSERDEARFSWMLTLATALTLCAPALAADPTPPDWVKAEEYCTFADGDAYQAETWQEILRLRSDAAAGNLEPKQGLDSSDIWFWAGRNGDSVSLQFELGLIAMQYAENSGEKRDAMTARRCFSMAHDGYLDQGGTRNDATYNLLTLWYLRARRLECRPGTSMTFSGLELQEFLERSGYTMNQFRDCSALKAVTEAEWAEMTAGIDAEKAEAALAASRAKVTLDGNRIDTENLAKVVNGRTMIPARYVSELFGQSIQWVSETRTAAVTENKALAGDTNLEQWAMPMGAYLGAVNNGGQLIFGGKGRGLSYGMDAIGKPSAAGDLYTYEWARYILEDSWSIRDRAGLIETVCSMTAAGHNANFLHDVEMIASMTDAEYRALLSESTGVDAYMFPYTKALGEKWGERGILCWDLFRMSTLVQWGYAAGYLTYPEALALLEPAAAALRENFSSWEEACENYLGGYNWWARENVGSKDPWTVTRGPYLKNLMEKNPAVFDDALFSAPIKGVDGISAQALLESVQTASAA